MTDRIELVGSGWTASATVVEELGSGDRRALRLLRVVEGKRPAADRAALVVARLTIDSAAVDLAGVTASWSASENPFTVDLVLAVHDAAAGSSSGAVSTATPLAGDIPTGWLTADVPGDVEALHRFVGVIPSPHQDPVLSPDGVLIRGARAMPWDSRELSAPYTAHPLKGDRVRVTPELARLDAGERAAWAASWRAFASMLGADGGPEWMRLHVPNPRDVPAVAFIVDRDGDGTRREAMILPTGSLVVELTDGVPGHAERPVRSVLRLHPTSISIGDTIDIAHVPKSGDVADAMAADADPEVTVSTTRDGGTWTEAVVVDGRFHPDPVALAEQLRASTVRAGSKPGVLTASTVLADGWLRLPVPDVVDQDYVDRSIDTPKRTSSGRAEGAVVWGNEAPELRSAALASKRSEVDQPPVEEVADNPPAEEPEPDPDQWAADDLVGRTRWSLALLDANGFRGSWETGTSSDGTRRLVDGTLELFGVSATADGLWWLAAEAATPDASPTEPPPQLDSWSQAVAPVPVHAGGAVAGRRRSAVTIDVHAEFAPRPLAGGKRLVGELATADLTFGVDATVAGDLGLDDPEGAASTRLAIAGVEAQAWLRHPTVPTVQSLPLDTTAPRHRPSAARQLMPWMLGPAEGAWVLTGGEHTWPRLGSTDLALASTWVDHPGLTQAVLSMPGVEFVPAADGLRLAVRHDLPLLDEAAAFASVDDGIVEVSTPEPWWRLDERGVLAALEQARLLAFDAALVDHAAESTLPVADGRRGAENNRAVATDLSSYPGTLTVGEQTLFDPDPEAGDRLGGRNDDTIGMHSGAIPLAVEGPDGARRTRDQDDIGRGDATISGGWLRIPVYDGDTESYVAASSLTPLELTGVGRTWLLAVDGLPMRPRSDGEAGLQFHHDDTDGLLNDDDAAHRTHRWRLGPGPLSLGGLEVYPVRLTSLTIDDSGQLADVEIDARLQLPTGGVRVEQPRLPGLVRLRFEPMLTDVQLLDDEGVWPVGQADGSQLVELRWGSISHHEGIITVGKVLDEEVTDEEDTEVDITAHFHLFDQPWALTLDDPLRFSVIDADSGIVGTSTAVEGTGELQWTKLQVTLDLSGEFGGHSSALDLKLVAGTGQGGDIVAPATIDLGAEILSAGAVTPSEVTCFGGRLVATGVKAAVGPRSLQLSWSGATEAHADATLELLPGMALSSSARPGVVSARFEPHLETGDPAPELRVTALHAEQVLGCSWEADPRSDDVASLDASDSPYRGDLSVGYVGTLIDGVWEASFLLDGVIEIAGLVSHAGHDDLDAPGRVTPYSPTEQGPVIRHKARILFQQHRLTDLHVRESESALVGLAGPIELDAVVEHSLRRLTPGEGHGLADPDDRFTVPQRVLLLRPADLAARLARQRSSVRPIGGLADPAFTDLSDRALAALPEDSLVIEASVSALVRRKVRPVSTASRLRTVPAGVVEVVRAGLDDHLDESPPVSIFEQIEESSGLVQLDLPFVAVALAAGAERPPADSAASALVVDPVDLLASGANGDAAALARLLTSRVEPADGQAEPEAVELGAFDGDARTFAHAAERRIATAWQLLADPDRDGEHQEREGDNSVTDGILASEPDVLGRMGSPTTLRRVLGSAVVARSSPRPPHHVSFDRSGRTWAAPVVAFDFTVDDQPRGTHAGKLETSGTGWHLDAGVGLHLTDRPNSKERMSKATVVGAAAPLVAAIKEAGAFSVHVRIRPDTSPQSGPARILSLSWSIINRLFTIGQEGHQIVVRVRNGHDGKRGKDTNGVAEEVRSHWAEGPLQHHRWVDIAYVFDGAEERLYINGNAVGIMVNKKWYTRPRARSVDFDSWDPDRMELLLGNEGTGKRPWFGHWAHVAVFAGAVTPADLAGSSPVDGSGTPLPFVATGPSVRRAFRTSTEGAGSGPRHHVATNILPVDFDGGGDLIPSPYVTFDMIPARSNDEAAADEAAADEESGEEKPKVPTTAELLLDGTGSALVSAGGRFWQDDPGDAEIRRWAENERARVGGDSARTVVRLRKVVTVENGADGVADTSEPADAVLADVGYLVLAPNPAPPRLGWRSPALRSGSARDRRPDRHLVDAPPWTATIPAPDIAPPLVTALDAVRDVDAGISGLSIDTALTPTGGVATNDQDDPAPVWLGVSRQVRFEADVDSLGQPADFDAPTRAVLSPTAAAPPLPAADDVVARHEQAVAVDRVRHLLTGIRPGALVEVRSHRQRRDGDHTFAAGTLPTVIRAPRPLESQPFVDARTATRPSAGLADQEATVLAESDRFELVSIRDEACLRVMVTDPAHGTISRDHNGPVTISADPVGVSLAEDAPAHTWSVTAGFVGGPAAPDAFDGSAPIEVPVDEDIRALLRSTPLGRAALIRLQVTHTHTGSGRTETRQVDLPLRVVADDELPLMLEPRFCRFEDPEYNRAISTAVARAEAPVKEDVPAGGASPVEGCTLVVSKDRSAHAPGAPMIVGVQVRAPEGVVFTDPSVVRDVVADSLQVELQIPGSDQDAIVNTTIAGGWVVLEPGRVGWVGTTELPADLDPDRPPTLVVRAPGITSEVSLMVALVEDQTPPSPTAAYALLRQETEGDSEGTVSCPRYALGPNADRIALVDTHDVLSTIMRYRAEFTWTDVVRAGTDPRYEVQKISRLGATHIPPFLPDSPPTA